MFRRFLAKLKHSELSAASAEHKSWTRADGGFFFLGSVTGDYLGTPGLRVSESPQQGSSTMNSKLELRGEAIAKCAGDRMGLPRRRRDDW